MKALLRYFFVECIYMCVQKSACTKLCFSVADDLLGELSMALQRQILLVSPFTLKMADIAVNDHITVANNQGQTWLRIAWPHMVSSCSLLHIR